MITLTMHVRYPGAGKYWIAIKDDHVLGLAPMSGFAVATLADVGYQRLTRSAIRAMQQLESKRFEEYRVECRDRLSKLGTVRSGVFSCGRFYLKELDGSETLCDLTGPGMEVLFAAAG